LVIGNAPGHRMSVMLDDEVLRVTLVLLLDRTHTDKEIVSKE
jgi:hypothetical protein